MIHCVSILSTAIIIRWRPERRPEIISIMDVPLRAGWLLKECKVQVQKRVGREEDGLLQLLLGLQPPFFFCLILVPTLYHYIYKFKKMEAHYNFNFAPAMTRQLPLYSKLWIVGGILAVACTCTVSKVWQILGHLLCMTNEDVCNKWQQFSHKSPHRCQHIFM